MKFLIHGRAFSNLYAQISLSFFVVDMLCKGFENVYHLKGGILKYLEVVPDTESLWSGECFVFDQRAAVCTGVMEGHYEFCRACRAPLTQQDKQNDPHYEDGVSCLHCYDLTSEKKKGSARERNLQVRLADERNLKHLGYHKGGPYSEVDTKHQNMGHTAIRIDDIAS